MSKSKKSDLPKKGTRKSRKTSLASRRGFDPNEQFEDNDNIDPPTTPPPTLAASSAAKDSKHSKHSSAAGSSGSRGNEDTSKSTRQSRSTTRSGGKSKLKQIPGQPGIKSMLTKPNPIHPVSSSESEEETSEDTTASQSTSTARSPTDSEKDLAKDMSSEDHTDWNEDYDAEERETLLKIAKAKEAADEANAAAEKHSKILAEAEKEQARLSRIAKAKKASAAAKAGTPTKVFQPFEPPKAYYGQPRDPRTQSQPPPPKPQAAASAAARLPPYFKFDPNASKSFETRKAEAESAMVNRQQAEIERTLRKISVPYGESLALDGLSIKTMSNMFPDLWRSQILIDLQKLEPQAAIKGPRLKLPNYICAASAVGAMKSQITGTSSKNPKSSAQATMNFSQPPPKFNKTPTSHNQSTPGNESQNQSRENRKRDSSYMGRTGDTPEAKAAKPTGDKPTRGTRSGRSHNRSNPTNQNTTNAPKSEDTIPVTIYSTKSTKGPIDQNTFMELYKSLTQASRNDSRMELFGADPKENGSVVINAGNEYTVNAVTTWIRATKIKDESFDVYIRPKYVRKPQPLRPMYVNVTATIKKNFEKFSAKEIFIELFDRSSLYGETGAEPIIRPMPQPASSTSAAHILLLLSFDADAALAESILNHIAMNVDRDGTTRREKCCFPVFATRLECRLNVERAKMIIERAGNHARTRTDTSPDLSATSRSTLSRRVTLALPAPGSKDMAAMRVETKEIPATPSLEPLHISSPKKSVSRATEFQMETNTKDDDDVNMREMEDAARGSALTETGEEEALRIEAMASEPLDC
jgi:hypothetical protein